MFAYNLVSEDGISLSLGRISFWILLVLCTYFWFFRVPKEFPDTLYNLTIFCLAYNFGKKIADPLAEYLTNKISKEK